MKVADMYAQGNISLREAADILSLPLIDAMELMRRQGVKGNVTMEQALASRDVADSLSVD